MNAMGGSVPGPAANWQMTGLFLLALVLLGFVMKLVALLLPGTGNQKQSLPFWLLLSPSSHRRLRPVGELGPILFRPVWLFGALWLSYWIYRWLAGPLLVRGWLLNYAALPILLLLGEFIVAVVTVVWLPSGQVLAPLHYRPVLARGIADFWGRRWNLVQ